MNGNSTEIGYCPIEISHLVTITIIRRQTKRPTLALVAVEALGRAIVKMGLAERSKGLDVGDAVVMRRKRSVRRPKVKSRVAQMGGSLVGDRVSRPLETTIACIAS